MRLAGSAESSWPKTPPAIFCIVAVVVIVSARRHCSERSLRARISSVQGRRGEASQGIAIVERGRPAGSGGLHRSRRPSLKPLPAWLLSMRSSGDRHSIRRVDRTRQRDYHGVVYRSRVCEIRLSGASLQRPSGRRLPGPVTASAWRESLACQTRCPSQAPFLRNPRTSRHRPSPRRRLAASPQHPPKEPTLPSSWETH